MGLNTVHLLAQTLPLLGDLSDKRLLTLGVQDCYFSYEQIIKLNAEIFRDCFSANGFEEITLKYIVIPTHPRRVDQYYLEYSPDKFDAAFSPKPYYQTQVYSVYRKVEEGTLTVPVQGFYRKLYKTDPVPSQERDRDPRRKLKERVRDWIDAYFVSWVVIHGLVQIWRGKKVIL